MNKKFLIPIAALGVLAIIGTTYFGAAKASDAEIHRDNMIQQLAAKLGLDQNKVQTAMDEIRVENRSVRQAEMEANLNKAVSDGVITAEQKQLILDKMAENQTEPGKKPGDMKTWAKENGIDMSKLKDYGFGKGPGYGEGGPRGGFNE